MSPGFQISANCKVSQIVAITGSNQENHEQKRLQSCSNKVEFYVLELNSVVFAGNVTADTQCVKVHCYILMQWLSSVGHGLHQYCFLLLR